jgi:hypothetical protein
VLEYFPEHEDEPEVQRAAGLLNEIGRGATGAA